MPVNPNAPIEITAFSWVPEFAQGVVRDLRARWALEEAGLDYRVRLLGQQRPAEYLKEQPFDQVPVLRDGDLCIFESGAIAQYVGEKSEALLPRDAHGRFRAIQWTYAALNSVEPAILNLLLIDVSPKSETGGGSMYGRDFEDPDGHQWEPMWMDPAFAEKGAHPVEEAAQSTAVSA